MGGPDCPDANKNGTGTCGTRGRRGAVSASAICYGGATQVEAWADVDLRKDAR